MFKLVLNLSNEKIISDAAANHFNGFSDSYEGQEEHNIDEIIKKVKSVKSSFSKEFSKCILEDKSGWIFAICTLNKESADLKKINDLYSGLKTTCGEKVYLLVLFNDRDIAGKLAWENENLLIDIQVYPENKQFSKHFIRINGFIAKLNKKRLAKGKKVVLFGYKPYAETSYLDIDYLVDTSYHNDIEINGRKIKLISQKDMLNMPKIYVLIGLIDAKHREQAVTLLKNNKIEFDYLENYTISPVSIFLDYMVNQCMVCYRDMWGNKFVYSGKNPYKIPINMQYSSVGKKLINNKVYIGNNLICNMPQATFFRLRGYGNTIIIKDNIEIISAEIIVSQSQTLKIGENSLISRNTIIRAENSHLIFDAKTKKLIKQKKDIVIGRHVWIGEDAYLLSGATIGDGSVLGAKSLTSGKIQAYCIAAGIPAREIRKDIIWSKDADIAKETLLSCDDQTALLFLNAEVEDGE